MNPKALKHTNTDLLDSLQWMLLFYMRKEHSTLPMTVIRGHLSAGCFWHFSVR